MKTQRASFVGIDLAWGQKARTGLAVVDDTGRLVASGTVHTNDEIAGWIQDFTDDVVVAAVDAPLIVPNETGQRLCETEISRAFWKFKIGAHSSNKSRPEFDPPRAATLAQRFGWSVDPTEHGGVGNPVCIEVYPHPAMVSLFTLPERIAYKKSGPGRADGFAQLVHHLSSIEQLQLAEHPRWLELSRIVTAPKPGDLTRIEDELDAILCAHLAWLWHHRPETLHVYGSLQDGYIVAPRPPVASPAVPLPPGATASAPTVGITVEVAGRPTGFAGQGNEQRWKAAVRAALQGMTLPSACRVALEVEYRLDPSQIGRNAPDLDNLLKSTIDALEGVLGARPGNFKRVQADDERIDRITASKRIAAVAETPGARITLSEL